MLGACAAVGVAPLDVLRVGPSERGILLAATKAARDFIESRDEALAVRIINKLTEAMKKR